MEKGLSLSLSTIDEEDVSFSPSNKNDEYVRIAEEIRRLSPSVVDSMMRIIVELQKTHASHCYMTCKKWLEMYGFHLTDLGHAGISDKFYFDKITPCDIVVYGTSQKVKTDDIILYAHFLNEHNLSFIHLKMKRMSADGTVDAESDIQKHLTVPRNNIIGKVLRVIPFNDPEWHEIVMEMVNIPWLEDKLHKAIKHYSNPKHSDMEKVNEINHRLQILGKIP